MMSMNTDTLNFLLLWLKSRHQQLPNDTPQFMVSNAPPVETDAQEVSTLAQPISSKAHTMGTSSQSISTPAQSISSIAQSISPMAQCMGTVAQCIVSMAHAWFHTTNEILIKPYTNDKETF